MLKAVLIKELRLQGTSFRFLAGSLLAISLVISATLIASDDYLRRQRSFAERQQRAAEEVAAVPVYSFLQPTLLRPPAALSVLDRGIDARRGDEVRVHLFEVPWRAVGGERGNPLVAASEGFDLGAVVIGVLGLLALLMTFDAVSGERKDGTLAMVLANPVRPGTLLVSKYLAAGVCLSATLSVCVGTSLSVLYLRAGVVPDSELLRRLAAMFGLYLVYLSLMLWLGLALSTRLQRPSSALVLGALLWCAVVLVLPPIAASADRQWIWQWSAGQATRQQTLLAERDQRLRTVWSRQELLRRPLGFSAALLETRPYRGVLYRAGSHEYYEALREYYQQEIRIGLSYAGRMAGEEQLQLDGPWGPRLWRTGLWLLSPAALTGHLSETFAGTGDQAQDEFLAACRDYREALIAHLNSKGAFDSKRWFTDDLQAEAPWPTLIGTRPEEIDESNYDLLTHRLGEPEVRQRLLAVQRAFETTRHRRPDLADLPSFQRPAWKLSLSVSATGAWLAWFLFLHAVLAAAARRSLVHSPLSWEP